MHFADLHDTPGRMKSKGVIRRQVNWAQSRSFFFWRLRRRLTEFDLAAKLSPSSISSSSSSSSSASGSAGHQAPHSHGPGSRHRREAVADLRAWFDASGGKPETWDDDRKMMSWLTDHQTQFTAYVASKRAAVAATTLTECVKSCGGDEGLRAAIKGMSPELRAQLLAALN